MERRKSVRFFIIKLRGFKYLGITQLIKKECNRFSDCAGYREINNPSLARDLNESKELLGF